MAKIKELTLEDVRRDKEFWYFYNLLKDDYKARLDTEYAVRKYFIEKHGTTDLRSLGKNNVPRYQMVLRKMYRVKSVFHCCQPTKEDKETMKKEQEKYKEINRNSVVRTIATQTALF